MARNLVAQVSKAGGDFELVEREVPAPAAGEIRIRVKACGICYSDHLVKDGAWPGLVYPRVPGHEVVGVIFRDLTTPFFGADRPNGACATTSGSRA